MAHECPVCGLKCHCGGDIDDLCLGDPICCDHCPDDSEDDWPEDSEDQFDDDQPQQEQEQEHHGTLYWEDFDTMERMTNPNLL